VRKKARRRAVTLRQRGFALIRQAIKFATDHGKSAQIGQR